MMRFLTSILLASGALAGPLYRRAAPLPPSSDPFYTPTTPGWQKLPPGTILNSRSIIPSFNGVVPAFTITAWQLLYVSTQANGTSMATVTTIFKPANARTDTLVSYSTAEDSNYINCAPSYAFQEGSMSNSSIAQSQEPVIYTALSQGWIVVSSDYEGPDSASGSGRQAGHGVLDGVKAAAQYAPLGLTTTKPQVALFGYSGGAIATGWAVSLASSYASSLNIIAAAMGGTPANVSGTLSYLDGTLFAGFGFGGTAGLVASYPSLASYFNKVATDVGKAAIAKADSQCGSDDISTFAFKKLQSSTYSKPGAQLLYQPQVKLVTDQLIMGAKRAETPKMPLLVYHSRFDEIIPLGDAATMVKSWCNYGTPSLIFDVDNGPSEHASLEMIALPKVIQYLGARITGQANPVHGCVYINSTLAPLPTDYVNSLGAGSVAALTAVQNVYSNQIGAGDATLIATYTAAAAKLGNTPATSNIPPVNL